MPTSDDLHQLQIIDDLHEAMAPCDSPGQKVEVSGDLICDAMDTIIELRAKLSTQGAELTKARSDYNALTAKLPKTSDGVPVVPGQQIWTFQHVERWPIDITADRLHKNGQFVTGRGKHRVTHLCYSTKAAAEAARDKGRK